MKKKGLLRLLQPKPKAVIITIHGYGRRRSHEMDNLAAWAKDERVDVIQFDLYDLFDEEDCDPKQWLMRAESVVRTQCARKLPVYLVGFSMGGVIASWLASRYPIEKLALIAPAFTYLDLGKAAGYLKKGTRMIFASSEKRVLSTADSFSSSRMSFWFFTDRARTSLIFPFVSHSFLVSSKTSTFSKLLICLSFLFLFVNFISNAMKTAAELLPQPST